MKGTTFPITRIYSDETGHSHFSEELIVLHDNGIIGSLSERFAVKDIIFREVLPSYDYDFHQAPQKQYIVLLDGEIEIETSLGDVRRFRGGDVLFLEDVSGKGHKTRNLLPVKRRSVFITL
jgi:hypothetical protein